LPIVKRLRGSFEVDWDIQGMGNRKRTVGPRIFRVYNRLAFTAPKPDDGRAKCEFIAAASANHEFLCSGRTQETTEWEIPVYSKRCI